MLFIGEVEERERKSERDTRRVSSHLVLSSPDDYNSWAAPGSKLEAEV